jgi:hypothetical protein
MSCCGKKRSNLAQVSAQEAGGSIQRRLLSPMSPASGSGLGVQFEYRGGGVLTVTGQGTGIQYRFTGYGARMNVDRRDRASLAAVPQLRELCARI